MRTPLRLLVLLVALVATACAGPSGGGRGASSSAAAPAPTAPDAGTVSLGVRGRTATIDFDARRVAGPGVRLERRADGAWEGELRGRRVVVALAGDRLRGEGIELQLERGEGLLSARGAVLGERVEVDLGPARMSGSLGRCGLDLAATPAPGRYAGDLACLADDGGRTMADAEVALARAAARLDRPELPQVVLAILALLPERSPPAAAAGR